jgi:DNA-binding NarL/FixJ family response regulator
MSIESVGRALRSVASGEAAVSRSLTSYLIEQLRYTTENGRGMRPVKSPLTTREWEVLDLICAGDSTREISAKLFLSEDTVYSHTKSILRKLGVHSRAEAVEAAARLRQPGPG